MFNALPSDRKPYEAVLKERMTPESVTRRGRASQSGELTIPGNELEWKGALGSLGWPPSYLTSLQLARGGFRTSVSAVSREDSSHPVAEMDVRSCSSQLPNRSECASVVRGGDGMRRRGDRTFEVFRTGDRLSLRPIALLRHGP